MTLHKRFFGKDADMCNMSITDIYKRVAVNHEPHDTYSLQEKIANRKILPK